MIWLQERPQERRQGLRLLAASSASFSPTDGSHHAHGICCTSENELLGLDPRDLLKWEGRPRRANRSKKDNACSFHCDSVCFDSSPTRDSIRIVYLLSISDAMALLMAMSGRLLHPSPEQTPQLFSKGAAIVLTFHHRLAPLLCFRGSPNPASMHLADSVQVGPHQCCVPDFPEI